MYLVKILPFVHEKHNDYMNTSGSGPYEDPPKKQQIKWQFSEMEKSFQEISKPSKA